MNALARIAASLERLEQALDRLAARRETPARNLMVADMARVLGFVGVDELRRPETRARLERDLGLPPPVTTRPLAWCPVAFTAWRAARIPAHLRAAPASTTADGSAGLHGAGNIDALLDARGDALAAARKGKAA